jgi:hypothetical protein
MEKVNDLVRKGKKYAETESTVERLEAMAEMWRMDFAEGSELTTGGSLAKVGHVVRCRRTGRIPKVVAKRPEDW